jgi:hypothetical protein
MSNEERYQHNPDYVSSPWSTAKDCMEVLETRDAPITEEMAEHLEAITGVPSRFWNNREKNYRERKAILKASQSFTN